MRARALIISAALAAVAAACATETPYAPAANGSGYGYTETQIETNRYRISFSGNSLTDAETVDTYLLYRAAELTTQRGYDWFRVVDRKLDAEKEYRGEAMYGPSFSGFHRRYYAPGYGWYPWYDPFWRDDVRLREIARYEASAEIQLGKGQKPADDPRAYDAREVQTNLAANIKYPDVK